MSLRNRFLTIILIFAVLAGFLAAGTRLNRRAEEDNSLLQYQTETVILWYSDDSLTDYFTNASVAFHEKYPDFRVIPTYVNSREYLEVINEATLSEEGMPDLYILTNDSLEKAYLSGLASPVDSEDRVINNRNFSDAAINAVTYKGKKIAYPLYFETSVLVYNIDYLKKWAEQVNSGEYAMDGEIDESELEFIEGEEPVEGSAQEATPSREGDVIYEEGIPKTFTDILNLSQGFDTPEGVQGIIKWDISDIFYTYFFTGNYLSVGGDTGDDLENIDVYNDDTVACLEMYQSLNEFFSIDAKTSDYESVLNDFMDGKYVFSIVTSDAIKKLEDHNNAIIAENEELLAEAGESNTEQEAASVEASGEGESEEAAGAGSDIQLKETLNYGFALIPDVTEDLKSRSLSVTDCLVINSYSEKKEVAEAFAEFLVTDYADQIYLRAGKLSSSLDAGYTDDAFTVFQGEYANSVPLSKIVEASNLWVQLEVVFKEVWDGANVKTELKGLEDQLSLQIKREVSSEPAGE